MQERRSHTADLENLKKKIHLHLQYIFFLLVRRNVFCTGMVCNTKTRKMEWQDGSKIDYTYMGFNANVDCVSSDYRVVSAPYYDEWMSYTADKTASFTMLCVVTPIQDCGDYDRISDNDDNTKPCFKIFSEPMSWRDAQKQCSDDFGSLAAINSERENDFFWRSAESSKILDDMHIGAYRAPDEENWKWIDNVNASDYSNFNKAFPINGGGSCTAMLTESSTATWINEDCDHDKLPFVCRRAGFQSYPKECSAVPVIEGKEILAPG
ncbi:hypothetical protein PFISCL1PPCAC_3490 [Pristionchus fissidentatus]|uniref:C-type lectin domain-containing protein n=1 Tax=Pristionchus fissidentatus TaxID=1538716 RepID=A0AAV5V187_9BILA|nr:hypothetical protein PFISCL1PPCAC_3490 [Pristionchus fissidentatus]